MLAAPGPRFLGTVTVPVPLPPLTLFLCALTPGRRLGLTAGVPSSLEPQHAPCCLCAEPTWHRLPCQEGVRSPPLSPLGGAGQVLSLQFLWSLNAGWSGLIGCPLT